MRRQYRSYHYTTRPGRFSVGRLLSEKAYGEPKNVQIRLANADKYVKYMARRDRALATIVLAVDLSLLYLIGDLENPKTVWTVPKEDLG